MTKILDAAELPDQSRTSLWAALVLAIKNHSTIDLFSVEAHIRAAVKYAVADARVSAADVAVLLAKWLKAAIDSTKRRQARLSKRTPPPPPSVPPPSPPPPPPARSHVPPRVTPSPRVTPRHVSLPATWRRLRAYDPNVYVDHSQSHLTYQTFIDHVREISPRYAPEMCAREVWS